MLSNLLKDPEAAIGDLDSHGDRRSFGVLILAIGAAIPIAVLSGWFRTTIALTTCFVLALGLYALARRGARHLAAQLALLMVVALLSYEIWRSSGLRNVAVVGFPAVVALASLLLTRFWFVATTVVSLLVLTALMALAEAGIMDVGAIEHLNWGDFGALLLILIAVAVVVDAQATGLRRSVASARDNQRALATSEGRFRALIENVSEVIAVLDENARVRYVSPAIRKVLGYEPEERVRIEAYELVHPDDVAFVRRTFARALREPEMVAQVELRMRHQSGEWRWIGLSGRNLMADPDVRGIVLSYRDITVRKRAEDALRESEQKFMRMFQANPSPMSISSAEDGRLLEVNDAMVEISGWSREEAIGHTAQELDTWVDHPQRAAVFEELRRTGSVRAREVRVRRKGGGVLTWVLSAEVVELAGGPCILWSSVDVTENKRLADQLQRTQKMEAIGRLAGGVAHDFNNWLTPVVGYSELILATMDEADPQRRRVVAIHEAGKRAAELAGQLLRVGRGQAAEAGVLDVNQVVLGAERLLRGLIGEDVELSTHLAEDLGPVLADRSQLEQVLLNLAVNARDAMPGGGRLVIETEALPSGDGRSHGRSRLEPGSSVLLAVSDTGLGMDADTQSKIFEPFFTTKEVGKGTGIGLATVYGIVQQIGGEITVYSEPGKGTTFKIYLPTVPSQREAEPAGEPSEVALSGGETVLLVEDQKAVREFAEAGLRRYGYRVIVAEGGEGALQMVAEEGVEFDVLVTDVVMPRMSGPELAARIAELRPECRVVYVSGYTGRALIDQRRVDPSALLLHKPFSAEELARIVRQAVEGTG